MANEAQKLAARKELARRELMRRQGGREDYGQPIVQDGQYQVGGDVSNLVEGIGGVVEPALSMATGTGAEIYGNMVGGLRYITDPVSAPGVAEDLKQDLTYQPRTQLGQSVMQGYGELMEPVAEVMEMPRELGEQMYEDGYPEWLARNMAGLPEYTGALFAAAGLKRPAPRLSKLKAPSTEDALFTFSNGKRVKYAPATKASAQGWSDDVVYVAREAARNPATQSKAKDMIRIAKRAKRDPTWGANNRPFQALGESVMERYQYLKDLNKSINIDGVAKEFLSNKSIDHIGIISQYNKAIAELGGTIGRKGELLFKKGSRIRGQAGNRKALNIVKEHIDALPDNPSAYDMHLLKQKVDDWINWGKQPGTADPITSIAEAPLKQLRRSINQQLKGVSGNYDAANVVFSDTKNAMNAMGDAFGKTLYGPSATTATGKRMRRWIGNAVSADPIADAYRLADDVARRYGANFSDAVEPQVLLANALDDVLSSSLTRTTGKAEFGRQGVEVLERSTLHHLGTVMDKGLNKMRGVDDMAAIKSLEDIINAGQ